MLELNREQKYSMLNYLTEDEEVQENFHGLMEMQQLYRSAIREVSTKLEILNDEFVVRYAHNPIHYIQSRLKSVPSLIGKLKRRGLDINVENARANIMDIAGIRVICCYVDDIYRIAEMLLQQNDLTLITTKDYIQKPKENGYRSLHLVVSVPVFLSDRTVPTPVEIQIRTMAMDFWASLEHHLRYKTQNNISEEASARLKHCAEQSALLDMEMQELFRMTNGDAAALKNSKKHA